MQGVGGVGFRLDTGVVGRPGILALDSAGSYVVIELRAGEADERVCGQIPRYLGWVKREYAQLCTCDLCTEEAGKGIEDLPEMEGWEEL